MRGFPVSATGINLDFTKFRVIQQWPIQDFSEGAPTV